MDTLGPSVDDPSGHDERQASNTLGHQGVKTTGGNKENHRVLWCSHMKLTSNYETIYNIFNSFGIVERIKLKMGEDEQYFEVFITFRDAASALSAYEKYDGSLAEKSLHNAKLISSKNLIDEEGDYIPRLYVYADNNISQLNCLNLE